MNGTRITEAVLFVEARIPKETPHATEMPSVIVILRSVRNV